MPGEVKAGTPTQALPADYQKQGFENGSAPEEEVQEDTDFSNVVSIDGLQEEQNEEAVATITEWLQPDASQITKWVMIPRIQKKILIRAMTDEERLDLRRRAPRKMQKMRNGNRRSVADSDWIQLEIVRTHVVQPSIPPPPAGHELLRKSLSGELAMVVREITELSGFDLSELTSEIDDLD